VHTGDVLIEQGDSAGQFFVVISDQLEVVRPAAAAIPLSGPIAMVSSRAKSRYRQRTRGRRSRFHSFIAVG
jgi:hypothetical protein